ncbi:MAG TPA: hypothetical protein VG734_14390 [Lacunisphaera sp.]|nr:hypothetical protein [Lacunisphaera sp.]
MKRTLLALAIGLACGLAAHVAWFGARQAAPVNDFNSQLAWMKRELRLDSAQVARIRALHEQSQPRRAALAAEVARMRGEFAAFEQARRTTGRVDYVKFNRFVIQQRVLDHECLDSARELIAATAEVMTPAQRDRYLTMLTPALSTAATGTLN